MLQLYLDLSFFFFRDGQAGDLETVAAAKDELVRTKAVVDVAGLFHRGDNGDVLGKQAERAKKTAADRKQMSVGHVSLIPDGGCVRGGFKTCRG